MNNFGLYLVMTNPVVGYAQCAAAAVAAGVRIVQLRMKHASRDELLHTAREVRRVTQGTQTLFVVDDDPAVALMAGADGVHVGQTDMPPHEVRARFPGLRIVGLSTHNLAQVEASRTEPVDYIGVGPVYATPTKEIPDPTLGPELAGRMLAAATVPAVAIGGINLDTLPAVLAAGARNYAVVRAVCASPTPQAAIEALLARARTASSALSFKRSRIAGES